MIIEATENDFHALLNGRAPQGLRLVPDSAIAPPEVLKMLGDLADAIRTAFAPSAWFIVEGDEIVGLCSLTRVPENREAHIGYGVAPTRQGSGSTSRAIRDLVEWARHDPRVAVVSAEASVDNIASQRVLERNGFIQTGERLDAEDGLVTCWQVATN